MEHVRKGLSCREANKMNMVDYLATIGYVPAKIRGNDYWYASPFREEHTPSFKVDRKHNIWYDHGEGKGGNLVDFGLKYYGCTIPELLKLLDVSSGIVAPKKSFNKSALDEGNHITVTEVKELSNPALCQYAESRGITADLLTHYCKEVSYGNGGKSYYAIGFRNDLGGYELRSKYFKGSSAPKGITHFNNGNSSVAVFEGFFNFLSFQSLPKESSHQLTDFLILNSLSFFERARPIMESYKEVNLYLDNNKAGQKFTTYANSLGSIYKDGSSLYAGHEDLNDFLKANNWQNEGHVIRRNRLRL